MNAELFEKLYLETECLRGGVAYLPLPIPIQRDHEVSRLLRAWAELSEAERRLEERNFVEKYHRESLECYSERMASLAVRINDDEPVFLGLLALGVHGWSKPWRINVKIVSLHHDALRRIGVEPARVFEKASKLLPEKAAMGLRLFLDRPPHLKSIEQMWYAEGRDADGFRYKQENPLLRGRDPKQVFDQMMGKWVRKLEGNPGKNSID